MHTCTSYQNNCVLKGLKAWVKDVLVVMKQVIEYHPIPSQKSSINKSKNHIPEYALQFKKEWLYIRGINKSIESFIKKDHDYYPQGKKFSSLSADTIKKHIDRFLRAQKNGRLQQDISHLRLKETDVNFIDRLEEDLEIYSDVFYAYYEDNIPVVDFDPNDKIKYDEFCESYKKFKSQLKRGYLTYFEIYQRFMNSDDSDIDNATDSDSDSDSDSD